MRVSPSPDHHLYLVCRQNIRVVRQLHNISHPAPYKSNSFSGRIKPSWCSTPGLHPPLSGYKYPQDSASPDKLLRRQMGDTGQWGRKNIQPILHQAGQSQINFPQAQEAARAYCLQIKCNQLAMNKNLRGHCVG